MGRQYTYTFEILCGRSSVVERHVANVNVVSSNLIARFIRGVHGGLWGQAAPCRAETGCYSNIAYVRYRLKEVVRQWSHRR